MASSEDTLAPEPGSVCLILLPSLSNSKPFYLEIPVKTINSLCLKPRKFLRYLGWCILGVEGTVHYGADAISDNGDLVNQGIYRYEVATGAGECP